MRKSARLFLVLLFSISLGRDAHAAPDDSLAQTQAGCQTFIKKLRSTGGMTFGTLEVPEDWNDPRGAKIPLFWWKRAGKDPTATPLAFLHGGVAGNSWAVLDKWQKILREYPGDVISFDHRGEGCSKTLPSNLHPSRYGHLNVRSVVRDLEYLRAQVAGHAKWRVAGHSRGSALIHYYLEMAPAGLESAHAMGFSIASPEVQKLNGLIRAQGYYMAAKAYLKRYPEDEAKVKTIRSFIKHDTCWNALDDRKVCGPAVLDVFANLLSRVTSWPDLHDKIASMIDFETTYATIKARLPNDVYGHFHYIIGTNSQAFGSPDPTMFDVLKENPVYTDAFLTETRFVGEAIKPTLTVPWSSSVDPIDYTKIKRFLSSNPGFKYYLYAGALDPIAPPQAFQWEVQHLGPLVNYVLLPDSAHDGWFDPILIANILRK